MLTYKDQSWCVRSEHFQGCKNKKCNRNYTHNEHRINVQKVDLPLLMEDFKTEDCGYETA